MPNFYVLKIEIEIIFKLHKKTNQLKNLYLTLVSVKSFYFLSIRYSKLIWFTSEIVNLVLKYKYEGENLIFNQYLLFESIYLSFEINSITKALSCYLIDKYN